MERTEQAVSALRVGTRGSALALTQSKQLVAELEAAGQEVDLVVIRTSGDRLATVPLSRIGGKGLFIKELEEALSDGSIDVAVHSLKDVPAEMPPGFALAAVSRRADERDVLVLREDLEPGVDGTLDGDGALQKLPAGARVGTGSLRRGAQIAARRPDLAIVGIRGNVDTRLEKLRRGDVEVVVLAAAGVARLGLPIRTRPLDSAGFLPSPGQGALAIEIRKGDETTQARVSVLDDPPTAEAWFAERAFLRTLEASCAAVRASGGVFLDGLVASLDGSRILRDSIEGDFSTVGRELGQRLLERGAREILDEVERQIGS